MVTVSVQLCFASCRQHQPPAMLSLVEKIYLCNVFSYTLFRILTSPLSNLWKTVFTKKHVEGSPVSSFASLCLRTHPLLTFIMRSKWHFILFFSTKRERAYLAKAKVDHADASIKTKLIRNLLTYSVLLCNIPSRTLTCFQNRTRNYSLRSL